MPSSLDRAPCDLCGSRRHLPLGYADVFRGSSVFDFLESRAGRLRVVTCRSCGFIFFSPRLTPAAMRALYAGPFYRMTRLTGAREKVYSRKKIAATAGRNPDFAPEMVRFLRPHFDFAETSILEVRCKSGAFLLEAKKAGAGRLVGFDDFPPNVERCRYLGFEAAPFPIHDPPATPVTGTYDLIRLNNVLAHSASPTAALQLFADHLRPGGLVFVEEPDILAKERGPFPVVPFHYWHPTFNAIAALLAAKGFS
ncbi:MAG TPA: class I SAM-dependent methyltransferase, partial [Vicinamibacteria bacterium]